MTTLPHLAQEWDGVAGWEQRHRLRLPGGARQQDDDSASDAAHQQVLRGHPVGTGAGEALLCRGTLLATQQTYYGYPSGTELTFVQPDHLGSTSQVADSTGTLQVRERYAAFGERRLGEEPKTTEYLYTGQRQHNLFGLYHYTDGSSAGRFYDPLLGRFVQPDPVTATKSSQALNPYTYVFNNPLRLNDADGHCPVCLSIAVGIATDVAIDFVIAQATGSDFHLTESLAVNAAVNVVTAGFGGKVAKLRHVGQVLHAVEEAATHADEVVDTLKAADNALHYVASQADEAAGLVSKASEPNIVYRNMRVEEHPAALAEGVTAKNPSRRVHPQRHVTHGNIEEDNWISATRNKLWALAHKEEGPIYTIDLDRVGSEIVDTTQPGTMEGWHWNARVKATRSSEVLIDTYVPPEAIIDVLP